MVKHYLIIDPHGQYQLPQTKVPYKYQPTKKIKDVCFLTFTTAQLTELGLGKPALYITAVSYTHLDVYKRQEGA